MPARSMNAVPAPDPRARGGSPPAAGARRSRPAVGTRSSWSWSNFQTSASAPKVTSNLPSVHSLTCRAASSTRRVSSVHRHRRPARGCVQAPDVAPLAPHAQQPLEPLELGERLGERGAGGGFVGGPGRQVSSDEPMAIRVSSTRAGPGEPVRQAGIPRRMARARATVADRKGKGRGSSRPAEAVSWTSGSDRTRLPVAAKSPTRARAPPAAGRARPVPSVQTPSS